MASIYCEDHGLEIFEKLKATPDEENGSFTKVVIGPIVVDECRCNACNRPIGKGVVVVYISHHNKNQPDDRGERNYMDMWKAKVYKL